MEYNKKRNRVDDKDGITHYCEGGNDEFPCRLSIVYSDGYCRTHGRELREIKKLSKDVEDHQSLDLQESKPHCIYSDDIIKECKCTRGLTKTNQYCYNHKDGITHYCEGGNGYCRTHGRELREIKKLSKDVEDHVRQISIEIENNSDDDDDETL